MDSENWPERLGVISADILVPRKVSLRPASLLALVVQQELKPRFYLHKPNIHPELESRTSCLIVAYEHNCRRSQPLTLSTHNAMGAHIDVASDQSHPSQTTCANRPAWVSHGHSGLHDSLFSHNVKASEPRLLQLATQILAHTFDHILTRCNDCPSPPFTFRQGVRATAIACNVKQPASPS